MTFEIGQVIQLKSGGPKMTINKIIGTHTSKTEDFAYKTAGYSNGDLVTQWFNGDKLEHGVFKPEVVELVK